MRQRLAARWSLRRGFRPMATEDTMPLLGRLPPEKVQTDITGSRVELARKVAVASDGFGTEIAGLQSGHLESGR